MDVSSFFTTLEELRSLRRKCTDCCIGKSKSFHCPLCPVEKFQPAKECKLLSHLQVHWNSRFPVGNDLYAVRCSLEHDGIKNSHYHCQICDKKTNRKARAQSHANKCHRNLCTDTRESAPGIENVHEDEQLAKESDVENSYTAQDDHCYSARQPSPMPKHLVGNEESSRMAGMRTCSKCGKTVTNKWFKEHVKLHNDNTKDICNTRHHHTVIVDHRKGLFASSRNLSGPFAPVHLIKLTSGKESGITCESTTCYQAQLAAKRGGDFSFECPHARSTPYAEPGLSYMLTQESLESCVASGTITQEKADTVLQMKDESDVEDTPLVVMLPMPETSTSTVIHMSVFTRNIRYWSKFRRTVVTFNKEKKSMACRCCRQKVSCCHKVAGIWFLAQEMPEILQSNLYFEENDEECPETETSNNIEEQGEDLNDDNEKTRYLMSQKTYPVFKNHQVPDVRIVTEIVPAEEECCNNMLTTHLAHRQGKMITRDAIIKDILVYNKKCQKCGKQYRYQEWTDGIHNFNNVLFLSFATCHMIRAGLQNHVAIGRTVAMLQETIGEELRTQDILKAYLMFECLTDHSYSFNCVLCGHYPSVMIMDGVRKTCFRFAVSDMCQPKPNEESLGKVNMSLYWNKVENSIVTDGITKGKTFLSSISPTYDNWAPWIGASSRLDEYAYNTEYMKCKHNSDTDTEPVPDEVLKNLRDEKLWNTTYRCKSTVKRFCRELGIRPGNGSVLDLILKMRENSVRQSKYDEVYEKIFGTTGGWVIGLCPHSVVYASKCLLRGESPRDFVDLLRSFKHQPNVVIVDVANKVASCGNRLKPGMFHPHEGRVAEATEENQCRAEEGLPFSLPLLKETQAEVNESCNPTTGSSDHYCLFDWFHEGNCKEQIENLRKISLVEGLAGSVDTQAAEQFFNSLKRDLYFINQMSPLVHVFICRLLFHLHNETVNDHLWSQQQKMTPYTLSVNEYGQIQHTKNATTNATKSSYLRRRSNILEKDVTDNFRTNFEQEQEVIYTTEPVPVQTQDESNVVPKDNSLLELFIRKITDYLEASEELSVNEQEALDRNIKYANETIGTSTSIERRQQISEQIVDDIFIQCQGSSNYCGLCVVNNILGPDQHNNFPVTIEQMDELADNMWLNIANDPFSTPSFILPVLRDREGFYTIEVLLAALEHNDLTTVRLNPSIVNHSTIEEIWSSLKLYDKEAISLLIRYKTTAHYVAITWRGNCYRLIDSREPSARLISPTQMSCVIKLHCNHPGSIYLVQRNVTSEEEYWERTFENQESPHTATKTKGDRQNQYETNMEEDILDNMESQRHELNNLLPGTHHKDNTTEDVEEQTSDENDNGTEYMTNIENIMWERNYELRMKPTKKRRKSFWYEYDQKKNAKGLQSCSMEDILRNTDKKEDLQNDEECSMKDMSMSFELEHDVEQLKKDSPDNQEVGDSEEEDDDIDEDFSLEFADFEKMGILTYIYGIMHCVDSTCDEADHERHHQFICNPETIYNKERKRVAFGCGVISKKIINALLKYLTGELVYNHQVPFRFGGRRIRKLKNIELNNIFLKYKFFADHYVTFVLHKEAIIYFHQKTTMCPYEFANEKCMETEVDVYNEVQKKYRK